MAAISESEPVNPIPNNGPFASNISAFPLNSGVQPTSASTSIQDAKQKAKTRARKRKKELLKKMNDAIIEIKMAPHKPRKSTPEQDSEDEDMIEYNPDEFDPDEYVQKYYNIGDYTSVITPTCYKNLRACGLLVAGSNSGVTEDPPYRGADARYIYRDSKFSRSCGVEIYRDGCLTVGRLVVRASDSRPEGLGSMPPNTLRVHTEYVLVKSVGLKSCGLSNERRGLDNISLSFSSITEIVEVKVGGVAIYRPFGLNRTVTCMVLKANNRRTSSPLPR
ncbi:hypothetical protein TNCV_222981 [Trichonephila clavipes]|nr:hypothetical protein TNCV_222981 [Trichonephila clavipes]